MGLSLSFTLLPAAAPRGTRGSRALLQCPELPRAKGSARTCPHTPRPGSSWSSHPIFLLPARIKAGPDKGWLLGVGWGHLPARRHAGEEGTAPPEHGDGDGKSTARCLYPFQQQCHGTSCQKKAFGVPSSSSAMPQNQDLGLPHRVVPRAAPSPPWRWSTLRPWRDLPEVQAGLSSLTGIRAGSQTQSSPVHTGNPLTSEGRGPAARESAAAAGNPPSPH